MTKSLLTMSLPNASSSSEFHTARFPFVSKFRGEIERNALYIFISRWTRLMGNRSGFNFNQGWYLP